MVTSKAEICWWFL